MQNTIKINRFPKMAFLQFKRALLLNYPKWQAKAIGLAQARKYALFKNRKSSIPKDIRNNQNKNVKTRKDVLYSIYTKNKTFNLYFDLDNYPVVGSQKITEKDFDKYMMRLNKEVLNRLDMWSNLVIKQASDDMLKTETKFFNKIWKPHRDDLI